jgi:intracellular sulfur oxidation DsrE/DsrF family protein
MRTQPPPATPSLSRRRGLFAALLPVLAVLTARRATAAEATQPDDQDKPFADHHLCLQLSDDDPAKQALVLSVANNMLKQMSPDMVAIEVVTFGPGIVLLEAGNPLTERVDSLVAQGVRFDLCMNTVHSVEGKTGKKLALNPRAHPVDAGVAQLVRLSEQKYAIVRP